MTAKNSLVKVFVNGFWAGFIKKMYIKDAILRLRTYRRKNPHNWGKVTIYENDENELSIYSDYGSIFMLCLVLFYQILF